MVVIGAGPAGEACAGRAADGGLSVALVEQHLVGGECSYYACMPSKALLRPAELMAEVQRVPGVREAVTGGLDAEGGPAPPRRGDPRARRLEPAADGSRSVASSWCASRGGSTASAGYGPANDLLEARRAVVVATGSRAAMPPIPGLRESRPWTNREATTAAALPGSPAGARRRRRGRGAGAGLVVARVVVTVLVEAAPRLIAREEPFASEQVAEAPCANTASTCAPAQGDGRAP